MKNRVLYKDTLLYRGVSLVYIDRSFDAVYWINRHGLSFVETIETDDTKQRFNIYRNEKRNLATAIPA